MRKRWALLGLGAALLACDASNPVAPVGGGTPAPATSYTIALSVSSATAYVGAQSPVRITIDVVNNADASKPDNVSVTVSTSLGTFAASGGTLVTATVSNGQSVVDLMPGDEAGEAEILARIDDSAGSAMVKIEELPDPPAADFTFETSNLDVIFTNTSTGEGNAYEWDFGEGRKSTETNPVKNYLNPGTYQVKLIATNLGGTSDKTQFVDVAFEAPVADFKYETDGLKVIFTSTSTGDPDTFEWKFGDGKPGATGRITTHTYDEPDTYEVILTVTNEGGEDTSIQFVTVEDTSTAPEAGFAWACQDGTDGSPATCSGLTVTFSDTSSGIPTSWAWDFGDGTMSTVQNPGHVFPAEGSYPVTLEVENPSGKSSITQVVSVTDDGTPTTVPQAAFSTTRNLRTVIFTDESTGDPMFWQWDFGDGVGTSTDQSPVYTYTADGTFAVTLTVINATSSDSTSRFICVDDQPPSASCPGTTSASD